jgi:hypothetical protein
MKAKGVASSSRALPETYIGIVDDYYKTVKTSDEIERVSFINEFRRLLESAEKLWRALSLKGFIPKFEAVQVTKMLN